MLIEHLRKEFAARTRANPRYSLRSFSRALKMDSSTLSALMRNKRPLTAKTARRLLDTLDIGDPETRKRIFAETFVASEGAESRASYTELDLKTFAIISSWEHFAILAALEISLARPDVRSIAELLDISQQITMNALNRLEQVGLVFNQFGRWRLTGRNLTTAHNIPNDALKAANRQLIEKALESLEKDPVNVRDISGITMAINERKIPEAKKRIAEFRRGLAKFLEEGKKTAVYRLNLQLFPLTRQER